MTTASEILMVSTSVANRAEADTMARVLVEGRYAACVQIMPISSVYRWKQAVETATEFLLLAKIRAVDFAAVETAIRAHHSYDLPEIIAVPIAAASIAYLDWIASATAR